MNVSALDLYNELPSPVSVAPSVMTFMSACDGTPARFRVGLRASLCLVSRYVLISSMLLMIGLQWSLLSKLTAIRAQYSNGHLYVTFYIIKQEE